VTGDAGARAVIERDGGRVAVVDVNDALPLDVDTPADLARLDRDRGNAASRSRA
jgi:CTP:molybdopterin cytidylyltransferase MocA